MRKAKKLDARVQNLGTIFIFHLLTAAATEWWRENVGSDSTAVEHRCAWNIAQGMAQSGLKLQ